ncbi:MAG: hypothetical protein JW969_12000 [Spirochaetales bacterium]|nr:hypothetical protein [Spirochaetales bacterium]
MYKGIITEELKSKILGIYMAMSRGYIPEQDACMLLDEILAPLIEEHGFDAVYMSLETMKDEKEENVTPVLPVFFNMN